MALVATPTNEPIIMQAWTPEPSPDGWRQQEALPPAGDGAPPADGGPPPDGGPDGGPAGDAPHDREVARQLTSLLAVTLGTMSCVLYLDHRLMTQAVDRIDQRRRNANSVHAFVIFTAGAFATLRMYILYLVLSKLTELIRVPCTACRASGGCG